MDPVEFNVHTALRLKKTLERDPRIAEQMASVVVRSLADDGARARLSGEEMSSQG